MEVKSSNKILNLILYSDGPEYKKMYHELTRYLKAKSIWYYFFIYREDQTEVFIVEDDILYIKGKESFVPGILEKTLAAFKFALNLEFDYIVRSNISTVINFDLLQRSLSGLTIDYGGPLYYYGSYVDHKSGLNEEKHKKYGSCHFVVGICIVLSRRAINALLDDREYLLSLGIIDDVAIGIYFHNRAHYIRCKIGLNNYEFFSQKFEPSDLCNRNRIVYRNKHSDRTIDVLNMKRIIDYLII